MEHLNTLLESERTKHVHRLHPYLGKFIPQLAEIFLRKYFKEGQTVYDPFVGSGTTCVQAQELGIHSIGWDICAFNTILVRAKTATYDLKKLQFELRHIIQRVQKSVPHENLVSLFAVPKSVVCEDEYLNYWFAPQALQELLLFQSYIQDYHYQDVLKVIVSRAARSVRQTTHYDLDCPQHTTTPYYCHKHHKMCTPATSAFPFLKRYCLDTLQRISQYSKHTTNATVQVCHGNATTASLPPISGVVTSPPYLGLIDYHKQHQYAYHLLGLPNLQQFEIGSAGSGTNKLARVAYQNALVQVFQLALDAMAVGGHLIIVANDHYNLYPDIARRCGVEVCETLTRQVVHRSSRRSSDYFESIFIWRKPYAKKSKVVVSKDCSV